MPKKILVVKLGGIGDVLLATPSLRSLRAKFPNGRIDLVVQEHSAAMIEGCPYIDNVILVPTFRPSIIRFFKELISVFALWRYFLHNRYDTFISLQSLFTAGGIFKPLIISYLSGARRKIGLDIHGRGCFLTDKITEDRLELKHNIERYLDVVGILGAKKNDLSCEVYLSGSDIRFAENFIKKQNIMPNDLLVGIHPGGNPFYPLRKSWPMDRFVELANNLIKKHNVKIILSAGPKEIGLINYIKSKLVKEPVMLFGATLKQFAAVISHCNIFIANDTGPMHIAVAMKIPTIGIFGPGDWPSYGSYPKSANFIMLRRPIKCWPCRDFSCTNQECMKLISAQDVFDATEKLINKK